MNGEVVEKNRWRTDEIKWIKTKRKHTETTEQFNFEMTEPKTLLTV